jgi:hypothetical protein
MNGIEGKHRRTGGSRASKLTISSFSGLIPTCLTEMEVSGVSGRPSVAIHRGTKEMHHKDPASLQIERGFKTRQDSQRPE